MKTIVKKTPRKGRGVFAQDSFKGGEVLEKCQLIIMELSDVQGILEGYVFGYDDTRAALALGNGSLINHSDHPNCEAYFDSKKELLIIRALKDIKKGQEVTINYGYTEEEKKRFGIKH